MAQEGAAIRVQVLSALTGNELCTVDAERAWSLAAVKEAIAEATGVEPPRQRLLAGAELLDCDAATVGAALGSRPPVLSVLDQGPWVLLEKHLLGVVRETVRGLQGPPALRLAEEAERLSAGGEHVVTVREQRETLRGREEHEWVFTITREGGSEDTESSPVLEVESQKHGATGFEYQCHIITTRGASRDDPFVTRLNGDGYPER